MLTESHHYHDVSSATLDLAGTILPGVRWRAHYFDRAVRVEISDVLHGKETMVVLRLRLGVERD